MKGENTQFSVVVRNIKFLDVYVGETSVDDSLHLVGSPTFLRDGSSNYILNFTLENQ